MMNVSSMYEKNLQEVLRKILAKESEIQCINASIIKCYSDKCPMDIIENSCLRILIGDESYTFHQQCIRKNLIAYS